jgi:predicted nucleic acid-binding Zn ribbon protein
MAIVEIKPINECEKCGRIVCYCGTAGELIKPPMDPRPTLKDLNEINGDPVGAMYLDDVLQPGCLMCGATIPEKQAKYRAKVCSDHCRNDYRRWRGLPPAERVANPLRCQVCRGQIAHRPNIAWVEVCSVTCRNAMRRYRFQILQNQKCPHCYHPSSEKEREEFRQWRASKGPMQEFFREAQGRGNFAWQREKQLRTALREAVSALRSEREGFCQERGIDSMEGLQWRAAIDAISQEGLDPRTGRIERFEELLAPRKKKGITYLTPSEGKK